MILSNSIHDKNIKIIILFQFETMDIEIIELKNIMENILCFKLKGVDGIDIVDIEEKTIHKKNKKLHSIETKKEYVLLTRGINLEQLSYLKGIDKNVPIVMISIIFTKHTE